MGRADNSHAELGVSEGEAQQMARLLAASYFWHDELS